jgi:hypothetical protein
MVRGGVGIYSDLTEPGVVGEVIRESGNSSVFQGLGTISAWPQAPDSGTREIGTRLSILGPAYRPPRSTRATLGIAHHLGTGALAAGVTYRHTEFLVRRHDLNRPRSPRTRDQYDRPIFGTPVQLGGMMVAEPGTNRRFDGFELVSALDSDGFSNTAALTVEWRQPFGKVLRVRSSHTWSRTTDNWLSGSGLGPYAQLSPFSDGLEGQDWDRGRSDLDLPHRASIDLEVFPLGRPGLSVAARYAIRSGTAFTPGFRRGVDANGDGSDTNDPAFVDETLSGMDALLERWPCLARQTGRFAARNSCREPAVSMLDLRLALGPIALGPVPFEVWVDALNVTDVSLASRDRALVLVDPATSLIVSPSGQSVTVPLLTNQAFGQPLAYHGTGRFVRIGLRLGYR